MMITCNILTKEFMMEMSRTITAFNNHEFDWVSDKQIASRREYDRLWV